MSHDFSAGVSTAVRDRRRSLLSGFPREQADLAFAASWPIRPGSEVVSLKPALAQHRFPLRALEQRLLRTQIAIGETPPAARQAEDRLGPELRRRRVHEDEAAARREQIVQMAQARRAHR